MTEKFVDVTHEEWLADPGKCMDISAPGKPRVRVIRENGRVAMILGIGEKHPTCNKTIEEIMAECPPVMDEDREEMNRDFKKYGGWLD